MRAFVPTFPMLILMGTLVASCSEEQSTAVVGQATPGYNTKIPESIMTPDKVETRIGTLKFFDGIPTKETAALLYDNLNFIRGVETFLNGIPATSVEGLRLGQKSLHARDSC